MRPANPPSCRRRMSRSWPRRPPAWMTLPEPRGPLPRHTVVTVQNGLGAEQIVRRHGDWPLVSGVTFMSGTRHDDTHVEYILDTETWLGPVQRDPVRAGRGAGRADRALRPEGASFRDLRRRSGRSDLQRDRQCGRGADRLPHDAHFAARSSRPTSATSSTRSSTRARRSPQPRGVELHEDPWE